MRGVRMRRVKAAKTRPLNAEIAQNLPKCDHSMLRVSESSKNAIVCENGGQVWGGRMQREEKVPKRDRQMQRLCKTCQNATVECRDGAKPAKIRPLNAVSERKQQKCNRMREWGAGVGWANAERGRAVKTRPWNAEIEQNLPKCHR